MAAAKKEYKDMDRWEQIPHLLNMAGVRRMVAESIPPGLTLQADNVIWSAVLTIRSPQMRRGQECYPLLECTDDSIVRSVLKAAQLGLEFGGAQGDCWMIAYGATATFQMGAYGYIKLAYRAGMVKVISEVIYESDKCRIIKGMDDRIEHELTNVWNLPGANAPYGYTENEITPVTKGGRGRPLGAYVVATDAQGNQHWDYVTEDVCNRASNTQFVRKWPDDLGPAYQKWPDEMRKRTAITRARKVWPRETIAKAMDLEASQKLSDALEKQIEALTIIQTSGQPMNGQQAAYDQMTELARGAPKGLPPESISAAEQLGVDQEQQPAQAQEERRGKGKARNAQQPNDDDLPNPGG